MGVGSPLSAAERLMRHPRFAAFRQRVAVPPRVPVRSGVQRICLGENSLLTVLDAQMGDNKC
eukprot:9337510-Lingulodinium_polyedra.AAC.1